MGISAIYKKDNELHEIYFPVQLEGLKRANAPNENSNTSNENKNITTRHKIKSISKISPSYNNNYPHPMRFIP